jgi:hypothetical protein
MSDIVKANGNGESVVTQVSLMDTAITPKQVLAQLEAIKQLMREAMTAEDYGKIPGCGDKEVLKKPGAEKICFMFRLRPDYNVIEKNHPNGHLEYKIVCTLYHINTNNIIGQGVGSCSTLESKYKYRPGPAESTGKPVPKEYWDNWKTDPKKAATAIGGKGYTVKKGESGVWEIFRQGEKMENPDPADQYNTVLKMAKKRAFVDATITSTAASELFTQDLEENIEEAHVITDDKPKQAVNPEDTKYANAQEAETIPISDAPKSVQQSIKGEAPQGETAIDKAKAFVADGYTYNPKPGKEFYNPDHTVFMNKKGVKDSARVTLNEAGYNEFIKWYRNNTESKTTVNDYVPPKDNSDLPF